VNGIEMLPPDQFVSTVARSAGQPVTLQIERGAERLTLAVTPQTVQTEAGESIGRIGVQIGVDTRFIEVQYGPLESLVKGVERTGEVAWLSLRMRGRMVPGDASWKNLSGPVTIADYAGQTARM